MEILKKRKNNCKDNFLLVDDIEEPTFICYDKPYMHYDYSKKEYKSFRGVKGEIFLQPSPYLYVIRMRFRVYSTQGGKHIVIEEYGNDKYYREGVFGINQDYMLMPKFSENDFIDFIKKYQEGKVKFEDGWFECTLEILKKTDQYFVRYYSE